MSPSDPLDWASLRSRLRSVIRSATYLATAAPEGATPVCRPFAPGLLESVVIDGEAAVRYVTERDLGRWSASSDEALDEGRWNLGRVPSVWVKHPTLPLFELAGEVGYEPSSLLVPGWLASQSQHLRGPPVVAIPSSSRLFMADGANGAAVRALEVLATDLFGRAPIPLSPDTFGCDPEGLVVPLRSVGPDEPDC